MALSWLTICVPTTPSMPVRFSALTTSTTPTTGSSTSPNEAINAQILRPRAEARSCKR
ncbi:MAG: hypothetical protein ACD_54C00865G0003, partial [uncultured bacterium]